MANKNILESSMIKICTPSGHPRHYFELFQRAIPKLLNLSNNPVYFGVKVDYFLLKSTDFILDCDICRVNSLDLDPRNIFARVNAIGHVPERGDALANHLIFLHKLLQTFLLQKNPLGDSLNHLTHNIFRFFQQFPDNRRCDLIPDDPLNNRILGVILKNADKFLLHAEKRGELIYFAIDEGHSWCLPQRFQIVYEIFNGRVAALELLNDRAGYIFG